MPSRDITSYTDINRLLAKLQMIEKQAPNSARALLRKYSFKIYGELVSATPVGNTLFDKHPGELREAWDIKELDNGRTYIVSNDAEYLLYVEFGLQKLSDDPDKRYRQLKYLFGVGILTHDQSTGQVQYNYKPYIPTLQTIGFLRKTTDYWVRNLSSMIWKDLKKELDRLYKLGVTTP